VISILSNLMPFEVRRMIFAALDGEIEYARKQFYALLPFAKATCLETNPMPIKAMMALYQMAAGPCRLPLCEMKKESQKVIETLLEKLQPKLTL